MAGKLGKTERRVATRIEAVRPKPTALPQWPLLAIRVFAGVGLLIGAYLTVLHLRAGASGVIDSPFCSVGSTINCNAVLGSAYAHLFGIPVGGWATITYTALLLISFLGQPALLVLLCGWTFVFSLYMAWVSWFVIKAACLFCMALYTVNIGLLVSAVALARAAMLFTGQQVGFATLGYLVAVVGFGWWQAQNIPEVVKQEDTPIVAVAPTAVDADFLRYYNARPVVSVSGQERYTEGPTGAPLTISEFVDFR
ncbi:MAG: vitamin K epoxide reductase family protein [Deltaproteobacteria bacterium]|nr:vitamin K epoxide reductase family protein [Deltaproteobacteria bacterium]